MFADLDPAHPLCVGSDGVPVADPPPPRLVFPGSFNPLHHGHRTLADVAARRVGVPVHFELSVANVDKPDLSADEAGRRVAQFRGLAAVWVTRAARFVEKAAVFPGAAFVVGWDTAARLADPRYHGHDPDRRDAALRTLREYGCRLIVGGRADATGTFRVWEPAALAGEFRELFDVIPEAEFRADVSSTKLRMSGGAFA